MSCKPSAGCRSPVIAAVNGAAAGGGMNLALGCDIRFGSTNAFFVSAFVKIGLMPDWGGFHALPRIVGAAKAMELMMTGDRVRADEALALGMLNRVMEADSFLDETQSFAARLASGPAEALAQIKAGRASWPVGLTGRRVRVRKARTDRVVPDRRRARRDARVRGEATAEIRLSVRSYGQLARNPGRDGKDAGACRATPAFQSTCRRWTTRPVSASSKV